MLKASGASMPPQILPQPKRVGEKSKRKELMERVTFLPTPRISRTASCRV